MKAISLAVPLASLLFTAQVLLAQQPGPPAGHDSGTGGMMMAKEMQQQMRVMDSMNARLDTLVGRMNRATGNGKVTAMAQVINELVAQRKAMQQHMQQMMRSHGRMMGPEGMRMHMKMDSARTQTRPKPGVDTDAADTAGHAEHPPKP